jgi:hypothetical protein
MPDYTSFRKVFNAASGGAATGGSLPPIPDKPKIAGYLPAPPEARFISSAEEAAKKLPPTVKAESIKNELLKRGAKPVELEYANIDAMAKNMAGSRVDGSFIHEQLQKYGPLGSMTRVEQQPLSESVKVGVEGDDASDIRETGPYPARIRKTYDAKSAYPQTIYHDYTEQGKRGDNSGYREVLYRDPANIRGRWPGVGGGQPISAHDSDYWVRYHNNPDSIAVQNIQSDVGQQWTKAQADKKAGIQDAVFWSPEVHGPVPTDRDVARSWQRMGEMNGTHGIDFNRWPDEAQAEYNEHVRIVDHPAIQGAAPEPDVSPIAKDDNWKNFLARQVILEAAKEGKPISLPTGANAHAVEMMPENAAKHFYEKDMPERIRKIIKSFDPKEGARVEVVGPAQEAADARRESSILWSNELHKDDLDSLRQTIGEVLWAGEQSLDGVQGKQRNAANHALTSLFQLNERLDDGWNYGSPQSISYPASTFGTWASDENLPPDIASQMQKVMSHLHLAHSRGNFYVPKERAEVPADARREGTWIHMSPVARREILEKGMPIMSVGAGALLGGLNDQSSER